MDGESARPGGWWSRRASPHRPAGVERSLVIALAVALVGTVFWFALLTARATPATVLWLDVGSPGDADYLTDMYAPEVNDRDTYRWTTGAAMVSLPAASGGRYRVVLALGSSGAEPRTLALTCDGGTTRVDLARRQGLFDANLDCAAPDGEVAVQFSTAETRFPADGRPLGVVVRDVRVAALDSGSERRFHLDVALTAGLTLAGVWLAARSLPVRRWHWVAPVAVGGIWLAITLLAPVALRSLVAGPGLALVVAAGVTAWALRQKRAGWAVGWLVVAVAAFLLAPRPHLVTLIPSRWVAGDIAAVRLAPWLAVVLLGAAVALGGRRAPWLAASATSAALLSQLLPVAARAGANRWRLTLAVPDWTDAASVAGIVLLGALAFALAVTAWVQLTSARPRPLALALVIVLALAVLLPWRWSVMLLNGDEPHYYVIAHSLAADRDLELLDDYLEPDYQAATISPTGNIAVRRDSATDRYAALAPAASDGWILVPSGLTPTPPLAPGAYPAQPVTVRTDDGDVDGLPLLRAATTLALPLAGPCDVRALWLATTDGAAHPVTITVRDAAGAVLQELQAGAGAAPVSVAIDAGPSRCGPEDALSVTLTSSGPVVAEALNHSQGLAIVPARPAAGTIALGGLPRDRFATQDALVRVALHNPHATTSPTSVLLVGDDGGTLRAISLVVAPGRTVTTDLPVPSGAAISVDAGVPLVVAATAWMPTGTWSLPEVVPGPVALPVPADPSHDAGVWLTLVNPTSEPAEVILSDARGSRPHAVCPSCARVLHVPAAAQAREIAVNASAPDVAMAAVVYQERTASRHFDLGLPLLAAVPVAIGGPEGAFVLSGLLAVALAIGLWRLLGFLGTNEPLRSTGALAVVLLAPVSPYAVRLYTEVLAATLVVWALVWLEGAPRRRLLYLLLLGSVAALPLVHGRYAPLAVVLALLAVPRVPPELRRRASLVGAGTGALVVVALLTGGAGLRHRASLDYFSPEWTTVSLIGALLDRGSGLLPFAPWVLLAIAAGRRLLPLQQTALLLVLTQASVVFLREGGWQTWGAPARYLLPVVPLLSLLAVPGAARLWRGTPGRAAVVAALAVSAAMTLLLHWLPLSGYVAGDRYLIDEVFAGIPGPDPTTVVPQLPPDTAPWWLGLTLLAALWLTFLVWLNRYTDPPARRRNWTRRRPGDQP